MSAMLITGLIVSSVPVLAFAEQGKEEIAAAASNTQEKDTKNDSGTDAENGYGTGTEIKTDSGTEADSDTKADVKIDTESGTKTDTDAAADTKTETGTDTHVDADTATEDSTATKTESDTKSETKTEAESNSEAKAEPEAVGKVTEEKNDESQAGEIEKPEQGDAEKAAEEASKEAQSEEKSEEAEEELPETELLPEEIPEELLTDIELATASNAVKSTEESMEEQLLGTWAVDDYTSLKFDEDGQGSMLLPESEYAFRYVLENDRLTLHFASSRAKDVSYIVSVYDDSMKLTGGRETINQEMILERIE